MTGCIKFIAAQIQHPLWTLLILLLLSGLAISEQLTCEGSARVAYTIAGKDICSPEGNLWALGGLLGFAAFLHV
jgi:hypothetical protein